MSIAHSLVFDGWMRQAAAVAAGAPEDGDVPVGALVIDARGQVVATARNERERTQDATAHAEVLAIRRACAARGSWQLPDTTLVVTLEPCLMCAGAILSARIPRVVFGAWDERAGASGSTYDVLRDRRLHREVEVVPGVLADECAAQLQRFFARLRAGGRCEPGRKPCDGKGS